VPVTERSDDERHLISPMQGALKKTSRQAKVDWRCATAEVGQEAFELCCTFLTEMIKLYQEACVGYFAR
jgi:hypothetical protein